VKDECLGQAADKSPGISEKPSIYHDYIDRIEV